MTVALGFNNQVEASEAARILGCAYSSVVGALSHKKLKGQKIEGKWMVDYNDLQRAKTTQLIKPRIRNGSLKLASTNTQKDIEAHMLENKVSLQFSIDKDKLKLIEMGLSGTDHTVVEFIQMKLEEMHISIKEALKNIKI